MAKLTLNSYWRSSCSWRVRSVLEYKNIPYEYRAINLLKKEQLSEEYRKLSPLGLVPALVVETKDGKQDSLFESLAIIDYLEQTNPQPSIYPSDPLERAKAVAIVEIVVGGIQPLLNLRVIYKVADYTNDQSKSKEWSIFWIEQKFAELEQIVSKTSNGGNYCVGNRLTLADICLVPQVYNALRIDTDMGKYPTIKRLYDYLLENEESIQKAKPENQPDAV